MTYDKDGYSLYILIYKFVHLISFLPFDEEMSYLITIQDHVDLLNIVSVNPSGPPIIKYKFL